MTSTRQSCDFCGATIRATDRHATVTIPLTDDERQLHARVRRDELTAAERRSGGYLPWPFVLVDAAQADRVFDMCLGCAQGLVRARLATVKAMREAWRLTEQRGRADDTAAAPRTPETPLRKETGAP